MIQKQEKKESIVQQRRQSKYIGSGWIKAGKNGDYVSITFNMQELNGVDLENSWISLYPNERKQNPKQPDYNLVASPTQNQGQRQAPRLSPQRPSFPRVNNTFSKPPQAPPQAPPGPGDWDDNWSDQPEPSWD